MPTRRPSASRTRRAALPLVAGLGAVGALAVARRRSRAEEPADPPEPLAPRRPEVTTPDGVRLHVEVHGAGAPDGPGPTATVVLVHGYVQSSRLWDGQVRDLLAARADLRVVTYDHRGHGASGRTARPAATLEQLGRDLLQVLEQVAPTGPVVLAGHSMGGMTVMALAEQRPDLFDPRSGQVAGVALVGTSAGSLAEVTYGLPRPVARVVRRSLPAAYEQLVRAEARGARRRVTPLERRLVFGRGADPALVRAVVEVQAACSAETMAAFLSTFETHDRLAALAALADLPAVVVVGDRDLLCPVEHSRRLAAALPRAELTVHPGVGHMVHLERRAEVSASLLDLVDRAVAGRQAPAPVG